MLRFFVIVLCLAGLVCHLSSYASDADEGESTCCYGWFSSLFRKSTIKPIPSHSIVMTTQNENDVLGSPTTCVSFEAIDMCLNTLRESITRGDLSKYSSLVEAIDTQLKLFAYTDVSRGSEGERHIISHHFEDMNDAIGSSNIDAARSCLSELCVRIDKIRPTKRGILIYTPPQNENLLQVSRRVLSTCLLRAQKNNVDLKSNIGIAMRRFRLERQEYSSTMYGVLYNLIINAINYRSDKEPAVTLSLTAEDRSGKWWCTFSISDNGVGMSEETIDKLFARGYRARETSDRPGSGIGLYSCKSAVEQMKGDIKVVSELGKGTTFLISAPCEGTLIQKRRKPKSDFRVAIAEDTSVNCKLLWGWTVKYLGIEGQHLDIEHQLDIGKGGVYCYKSGEEAYKAHKKNPYDLMFFDENTGEGRRGSEIADAILAVNGIIEGQSILAGTSPTQTYVSQPIIISISGTVFNEEFLKAHGFSGSLSKPIAKKDFNALISQHFELS